ncbi:MAG: hypothetical protein ACRCYO_11225 [Bacteroidia bacterium]
MTRTEFLSINDQPCRFKLKTGQEVFGVIWEKTQGSYYFASLGERSRRNPIQTQATHFGTIIDIEQIVGAEPLSENEALVS